MLKSSYLIILISTVISQYIFREAIILVKTTNLESPYKQPMMGQICGNQFNLQR